jgi:hypothetical protein
MTVQAQVSQQLAANPRESQRAVSVSPIKWMQTMPVTAMPKIMNWDGRFIYHFRYEPVEFMSIDQ